MKTRSPVSFWVLVWMPVVLFALIGSGRAGDFETGNELYDQGKIAEAKQHYEKLIDAGEMNANIFYNLGNADYRLGSPGRAMLNYERALALKPLHPEAGANLRFLRQQVGSKLPALSWWRQLSASRSLDFWTVVVSVSGWLVIFALVLRMTGGRTATGKLWLSVIMGVIGLAVSGLALRVWLRNESLAIVTARQTEARLAPAESAGVAEALPAGSRVLVLSERGPWIYCELPGAGRGWVSEGVVERVRPDHS